MSTDWKPGTVAKATVRGVPDVMVLRRERDWISPEAIAGMYSHDRADVTDVRPLVVLDPDEIATPEENAGIPAGPEIAKCLRRLAETDARSSWRARVAVRIADQIEAQTKPPRIPEPGLWGVVEARTEDGEERRRFVHHEDAHDGRAWERRGVRRAWDELIDPVLVREGVES